MSLRTLPEARTLPRPQGYRWDAPSDALANWAETPLAADADTDTTISMFDVIGADPWSGGGVTAARIAAALRKIGAREITVRINSPGGDMFEGIAIYNLLRGHPAKVTVEVPGWAASAASVIAMAGDEIRMGMGAFMMVHNACGAVIGNRHDMCEAAGLFDRFDAALADIYEARTGLDRARVVELMDAETFLTASEAVETGFADAIDADAPEPAVTDEARRGVHAKRRLDALLARQGMPRSERRRLMREATDCGTHDAAAFATHDAGIDPAALRRLIDIIRS